MNLKISKLNKINIKTITWPNIKISKLNTKYYKIYLLYNKNEIEKYRKKYIN